MIWKNWKENDSATWKCSVIIQVGTKLTISGNFYTRFARLVSLGYGVVPISFFCFECTNSFETMKDSLVLRRPKNLSCSLSDCPQYCPWHQSERDERKIFSRHPMRWASTSSTSPEFQACHELVWVESGPLRATLGEGEGRGRELQGFLRLGFMFSPLPPCYQHKCYQHSS